MSGKPAIPLLRISAIKFLKIVIWIFFLSSWATIVTNPKVPESFFLWSSLILMIMNLLEICSLIDPSKRCNHRAYLKHRFKILRKFQVMILPVNANRNKITIFKSRGSLKCSSFGMGMSSSASWWINNRIASSDIHESHNRITRDVGEPTRTEPCSNRTD